MAEIITKQKLVEANENASAWEKYWAGGDDENVITRLNKMYPTHAKALKLLMENGGLQPFESEAELLANVPEVAPTAAKALDTKKVWLWKNNAWVDTGLSELELATEYTDQALLNNVLLYMRAISGGNDLVNLFDQNDISAFRIAKNGDFYIYGITESIQNILIKLDDRLTPVLKKSIDDLYRVTDLTDMPLFRIAKNGDFYIYGIDQPIQDLLNTDKNNPVYTEKSAEFTSKSFIFNKDFLERVSSARVRYKNIAHVPNFAAPQRFNIGASWVNSVHVNLLTHRIPIAGYQPSFANDIGVVHPQVWSFDEPVAGYKYWMSINPYTNGNEDIELPFIYGSNNPDFKSWELISEFPQPFERDPVNEDGSLRGHLSDSGFCYDPKTGDLVFFWRKNLYYSTATTGKTARYAIVASKWNGHAWSKNYQLMNLVEENHGNYTEDLPSPNIVYNPSDDLFYLFYLSNVDGKLYRRVSPTLDRDEWSEREVCNTNSAEKFWHMDMKFIGNKLVALIHCDDLMTSNNVDKYLFAISDDFLNFNVSQNSIISNSGVRVYKPTFQPIFINENVAKFKIIHTSDSQNSPQYQLYVSETNEINLGE